MKIKMLLFSLIAIFALATCDKPADKPKMLYEMVYVEGGTFTMGCNSEQSTCNNAELPTHEVTLSSYHIGKYEITQKQWFDIMGTHPSYFANCDDCPVEQVSWYDIQTFLTKLNEKYTGYNFRLPTEAEWEYAAKGGTQSKGFVYAGSNNVDDVAWYVSNSYNMGSSSADYGTNAVGQKAANELGIHDMSGNVWEWCADLYGSYGSDSQTNPTGTTFGSFRVRRGGSWCYFTSGCRTAGRLYDRPSYRFYECGFRVVY